jgi:hypothetical protein
MMPDKGPILQSGQDQVINEGILELHIQFSLSCLPASRAYRQYEVSFFYLCLVNYVHAKAEYRIASTCMSARCWILLQCIRTVHHRPG